MIRAELPWVFGAFVEVNSSYFNTNGFYINTVIFSNTVILFMEGIPFAVFQYRPAIISIILQIDKDQDDARANFTHPHDESI